MSEMKENELLEVIEKESVLKKEHLNKEIKCLDKGFVRLVDFLGSDAAVVQAARVSYGKGTKKSSEDSVLIKYMMRHRHTSVFEMVSFKFHVKAPVVVFRQWHRHRTSKINELSGRFSEMPNECYVPDLNRFKKQSSTNKQGSEEGQIEEALFIKGCMENEQQKVFDNYERYLKTGLAREISRLNLPLSTYSEMYWKMDLHNLFHFLKLRLDHHAQWEIRQYAEAIYELIRPIVPVSCEAFDEYILKADSFSATEMGILKILVEDSPKLRSLISETGLGKRDVVEFLNKLGITE